MRIQLATAEAERVIAALANAQHGVVSRQQLLRRGLGQDAIGHRVRLGRLHVIHRGVYAVGHALVTERGHWMAAVLAAGRGAVLSHASAAAAWDLRASSASRIDVTVPSYSGRSARAGLRVHRRAPRVAGEIAWQAALPVTSPSRTLVDLAGVVSPAALERALERAELLRLFDLKALISTLERSPNAPGTKVLRRLLGEMSDHPDHIRSELERRFLALLQRHGLPRPLVNHRLGPFEVDFLWPRAMVIAETDGDEHHRTRAGFERDRARDARLAVEGYLTLRFTHLQVTRDPATVAATLGAVLAQRSPAMAAA